MTECGFKAQSPFQHFMPSGETYGFGEIWWVGTMQANGAT